jgi:hypothetical protein
LVEIGLLILLNPCSSALNKSAYPFNLL